MDEREKRSSDLDDVMLQETRRGRRPIDLEAKRLRVQRLRDSRKLLESGTEEEVKMALRAAGLRDGSPRFVESLRTWRENRL